MQPQLIMFMQAKVFDESFPNSVSSNIQVVTKYSHKRFCIFFKFIAFCHFFGLGTFPLNFHNLTCHKKNIFRFGSNLPCRFVFLVDKSSYNISPFFFIHSFSKASTFLIFESWSTSKFLATIQEQNFNIDNRKCHVQLNLDHHLQKHIPYI